MKTRQKVFCFGFGGAESGAQPPQLLRRCKSLKIDFEFLRDLCEEACQASASAAQMREKLAIFRENDRKFGGRTYAILTRNSASDVAGVMNLHPDFFTLFYFNGQSFVKATREIRFDGEMVRVKLKFFGVYLNGFSLGLRLEVLEKLAPETGT